MPLDPKLGPYKPPTPAWLTLLRKLSGWNPLNSKREQEGKISEARGERPRLNPLKLNKETVRRLAIQAGSDKNLEKMQAEQNPLRNERQGLILAMSEASCVGVSACPNCPDNVERAMREESDYCPTVGAVTEDNICSLAGACRRDPFSGDPYGDLCVTGRAGGTGGDLGGC